MLRTRTGRAITCAAVAVIAISCSSNRRERGEKAAGGEEGAARGNTAAGALGKVQTGGHVKLPSNEPAYLNPVLENRFNRATIFIFEGLVGLSASLEPVPLLAESWKISPDGRTITFALRKGVKWHDGKPFTSADVAFTYSAVKENTASLWRSYFSTVESVQTPDDYTVVVNYGKPYAPALIAWTLGIIPKHVFGGGNLAESAGNSEPVGTGPFKLARWEKGTRLLLTANEGYWNGRPHLDSIELVVSIPESIEGLKSGDFDFAQIPDIAAWSNEAQTLEFREQFEVDTVIGSVFRLIAWNTRKAPFSDPRVRLALTHSLNRERIIDDVLLGQARALSAPFFPNMPAADPSIPPHPFDLDRAVKLLDEAGHPSRNGKRFAVSLITPTSQKNDVNQEMFAIFRRDMSGIGIELNVEYVALKEFDKRITEGQFDAAFFGWLGDIPDPDPSVLLHSTSTGNYARYADKEADRLLEAAVATSDPDERKARYHELHAKLHRDLPYTVLYSPYLHYAWTRRLVGVNPNDISSQPRVPGVARWWRVDGGRTSAPITAGKR